MDHISFVNLNLMAIAEVVPPMDYHGDIFLNLLIFYQSAFTLNDQCFASPILRYS